MSFDVYWAYGLRIRAEIVCPELPLHPQPNGAADVTVRLMPAISSLSVPFKNDYYQVRPDIFRMTIAGVGEYRVEEGQRITVVPLEGASIDEVRVFLLGSAMGALLYQRGLFPLHGSAIETQWGAMIFIGSQGIGKSTLAAHFHRRGYRLLSDDVCAVTDTPACLQVIPALSQFRLCADAYQRLGRNKNARFETDKYVVPIKDEYYDQSAALKAIYLLVDHDDETPKLQILRGFDRLQCLLENLYRPQFLENQKTQIDLMKLAGAIAQKTTITKILRRRDPEKIERLIDYLELTWEKDFRSDRTMENN
jgi:hypothetical protein